MVWRSETGMVHPSLKRAIESLDSAVSSYFGADNPKSLEIEIVLTRRLAGEGCPIVPGKGVLRIYISDSPTALSSYLSRKEIVSSMIVNRLFPEFLGADKDLPEWISAGIMFSADMLGEDRFIRLPEYGHLNALYNSGWTVDVEKIFEEDIFGADVFLSELKMEISWVVMKSIAKRRLKERLVEELKIFFVGAEPVNNYEMAKRLLSAGGDQDISSAMIFSSGTNLFYPAIPDKCDQELKTVAEDIDDFLASLQKKGDAAEGDEAAREEGEKDKVSVFSKNIIKRLTYLLMRSPYNSQKFLSGAIEKVGKIGDKGKAEMFKELVDSFRSGEIYQKDKRVYSVLDSAEKEFVSPGARYSVLLDKIERQEDVLKGGSGRFK